MAQSFKLKEIYTKPPIIHPYTTTPNIQIEVSNHTFFVCVPSQIHLEDIPDGHTTPSQQEASERPLIFRLEVLASCIDAAGFSTLLCQAL